ncbi:MAG: hypothetical protein U5L10_05755 [Candidatus Moranbacteria bacterium]|nr:hypothetical protein [Candidatus Moranbacteria bacterium]
MKKNINLKSKEEIKRDRKEGMSLSVILGAIILFLTLASYGAVYFLDSQAKEKIKKAESRVEAIKKSMMNEEYADLYDFKKRTLNLKEVSGGSFNQYSRNLLRISDAVLADTVFKSLSINGKEGIYTCSASFVVPDRNYASSQLEAFNQSDSIKNVNVSGVQNQENLTAVSVEFDVSPEGGDSKETSN